MLDNERPSEFDKAIDRWAKHAFEQGAHTFADLLCILPGIYPSVALKAIQKWPKGTLPPGFFRETIERNGPSLIKQISHGLPIPHALDYDWRFATESTAWLTDYCIRLTAADEVIVLLGAPSLVSSILAQRPGARVTIVDGSAAMTQALRREFSVVNVMHLDLVGGPAVQAGTAAVVLADPPWYPEHVHSFLWAACRMSRAGGRILLSMPPIGTRSGIEEERIEMFAIARRFGLRLLEWKEGQLAYLSPHFEQNAIRGAGLSGIPVTWRHGDLAIFERDAEFESPRLVPALSGDFWEEVTVGCTRIKLRRQNETEFQDPALLSLVPGDILPSVSRRDPRRKQVDVWTSGNRVFACHSVSIVRQILLAIAAGEGVVPRVGRFLGRKLSDSEGEKVCRAADQASELIRLERIDEETGKSLQKRPASTGA